MMHHQLDPYPDPKDKEALFVNEPWIADKTRLEYDIDCDIDKKRDNVRIFVPIDLNKEAILRRLDRIIYHYEEANEDEDAMAETVRGDRKAVYAIEAGKSSPTEILEAMLAFNAEGRPIWKPMHLQPMYRGNEFVTVNGRTRGSSDAYIEHGKSVEVTTDIFNRGLCLPSDNNQTAEQAEVIIEVIKRCFR